MRCLIGHRQSILAIDPHSQQSPFLAQRLEQAWLLSDVHEQIVVSALAKENAIDLGSSVGAGRSQFVHEQCVSSDTKVLKACATSVWIFARHFCMTCRCAMTVRAIANSGNTAAAKKVSNEFMIDARGRCAVRPGIANGALSRQPSIMAPTFPLV